LIKLHHYDSNHENAELVQGIGQALFENTVYDPETGQLETGSFMDYCMPRADNFIPFKLETNTTLCAHNPLGAKGCGEAGTIGAPAAIMNAVVDALAPLGSTNLDMPATSERVWRAIAKLRARPSPAADAGPSTLHRALGVAKGQSAKTMTRSR
jgi:carbon-monoxide dehydrogenase large subunit